MQDKEGKLRNRRPFGAVQARMPPLRPSLILSALLLSLPLSAQNLEQKQIEAVEKIRGLPFLRPVQTVSVTREELPALLQRQVTKTLPYSVDEWETIVRSLRLVEEDRGSLMDALLDIYKVQVLAFYDPASSTYFLVQEAAQEMQQLLGGPLPADAVVVHELVHALQDQHFQIGKRDQALRHDADANLAYHSLLEGEATLVMMAYVIGNMGGSFDEIVGSDLVRSMLAQATTAAIPLGPSDAPRYFQELMKFPYIEGLRFAMEAYRRGGWKELDRIHRQPPRSTREILHPEEYFQRTFQPGPFHDAAPAGSRALSVEHLGEFHWGFLVGSENARGWKNDRVVLAENAACQITVLAETSWESEEAARRFHDAYARTMEQRGYGSWMRLRGTEVRIAYGPDRSLIERFLR